MKLKQLWTNGQIHNHFETKKYKCLIFHLIQISQFWFDQFFFILCYIYNNILLSSAKSVWFCCYTAPFSIFLFIQIFRKGILTSSPPIHYIFLPYLLPVSFSITYICICYRECCARRLPFLLPLSSCCSRNHTPRFCTYYMSMCP